MTARALITRPEEDAAPLAEALRARGVEVASEPLLAVRPVADASIDLARVQALLFTSANGVRAFAALTKRRDLPVFTVGDTTAAAARAAGFARVESAAGDVQDLARLVSQRLKPGDGALFHAAGSAVAGDLASLLGGAGFELRRASLYEAKPAERLTAPTAALLKAGALDMVLFFSPRTAATFVELVRKAPEAERLKAGCAKAVALCLSPAVATVAAELGWRAVRSAERPDLRAMLALVEAEVPKPATASPAEPATPSTQPARSAATAAERPEAKPAPAFPAAQERDMGIQSPPARGRAGATAAVILSVVLAFVVSAAVVLGESWWRPWLAEAGIGGPRAPADAAALEARVAALEQRLPVLEERIAGLSPQEVAALDERVGALEARTAVRDAGDVVPMEQRLATLEERLSTLEARPAGAPAAETGSQADLAALESRVAALERRPAGTGAAPAAEAARLDALEQAIAELRGQSVPPSGQASPVLPPEIAALPERLAALETRLADVTAAALQKLAAAPAVDPATIDLLRADAQALRADLTQLREQLEAGEAQLREESQTTAAALREEFGTATERLRAQVAAAEERSDAAGAALVLAVGQLRGALADGQPFATELATLSGLAAGKAEFSAALRPIADWAQRGVPTLADLRASFSEIAGRIAAAETPPAPGAPAPPWYEAWLQRLKNLVGARPVGPAVEGDDPPARVARAEAALGRGDLAAAVAELEPLTGEAATAARDWLAAARARLAAEAAGARLQALAVARMGEPPSSAGQPAPATNSGG